MFPGRFTGFLFKPFQPWQIAESIHTIDYAHLTGAGIDTILFDLDNTLVARDVERVPDKALSLLKGLRSGGFNLSIVSNNWSRRVKDLAAEAEISLVAPAAKPMRTAIRKAMVDAGGTIESTVLIGDQLFTDILGGYLLGIKTILVRPAGLVELPHTRLLRVAERFILSRLGKAGRLKV